MKKSLLATMLVLVGMLSSACGITFAESLEVEINYGVSVSMNTDQQLGSEIFIDQTYEPGPHENVPIVLKPQSNPAIDLRIGYELDDQRFNFAWTRLSQKGNLSGVVPGYFGDLERMEPWTDGDGNTPYPDLWSNRFNCDYYSFGFVDFWGIDELFYFGAGPFGWYEDTQWYDSFESDVPVMEEASWDPEKGAMHWATSKDISFDSAYATTQWALIPSTKFQLSLIGGVQFLGWEASVLQSISAPLHEEWTDILLDTSEMEEQVVLERFDTVIDRTYLLDSATDVSYHPAGIAYGLSVGFHPNERVHITASLIQSELSGKATFRTEMNQQSNVNVETTHTVYGEGSGEPVTNVREPESNVNQSVVVRSETLRSGMTNLDVTMRLDVNDRFFTTIGYTMDAIRGLPSPMTPMFSGSEEPASTEVSVLKASILRLGYGFRF